MAITAQWLSPVTSAFREHLTAGTPVLIDDVGADYASRGQQSLIFKQFFATAVGLRLLGCVKLPGRIDAEMMVRSRNRLRNEIDADALARSRDHLWNVTKSLVASDGFCVAQAL